MTTTLTIPESVGTLAFDQALLQATARAKAAYPAERVRIERGLGLCLAEAVTLLPEGITLVKSQSQPDVTYRVNGCCPCADAPTAPEGRCKHRWAKSLMKWARNAATDTAPATCPGCFVPFADDEAALPGEVYAVCAMMAPPRWSLPPTAAPGAALPEAPASVNCHITLAGRQVQLTLRDSDEGWLLARVDAVLQRFPAEAEPEGEQAPPEGWCRKHGLQMKRNHGKDGRTWYSHKTADGWCKGQ